MDINDADSPVSGEESEPMSFRARTARILALLAVFVILFLWGWALFFPPSTKAPGTLQDRTFPEAADQVCTTAAGELALLPKSYQTTDPVSRSEVVAKSDVILNRMLDNLKTIAPPADTHDGKNISEWLADWRSFVGNRESYAEALLVNPKARFYVSLKDKGQVTRPIDFFATFNKMYNCVTPDDIE
ncbi:MAG: hypothetical protein F2947_10400 [Actinobacteria bacterium]|nr:hypothetical protein [Actinomycetota bacterium]MSX34227.1 hypothetical protein [Actinomycetota bacterium]MSY24932.1 hypothetical protein [Actinomycetota bacterium]MSY34928.1 hypothetical protein [Actinomycetota bacterium]MSZ51788.1 hypothetical protein [Actinomycetota bacterium]